MRPLAVSTWRVRGPGVLVQDTTHRAGPKAGLDRASPRRPQGDALAAAWPPLLPSSPLLCSALRGVLVVYETDRRGNNSCPKKKTKTCTLPCRGRGQRGWLAPSITYCAGSGVPEQRYISLQCDTVRTFTSISLGSVTRVTQRRRCGRVARRSRHAYLHSSRLRERS